MDNLKQLKKKWDDILTSHGLTGIGHGERLYSVGSNKQSWFGDARGTLDGVELNRVHELGGTETNIRVPDWALVDSNLRNLLDAKWPKWRVHKTHRIRASRWLFASVAHWRLQWTASQIGECLGMSKNTATKFIGHIRKAGDSMFGGSHDSV